MDARGCISRFSSRVILDESNALQSSFPRKGRFILSGSSQFTLSRRVSESLAGRIGLLELHPFERFEMPASARKDQMLLGSFPELAMRNHEGSREWYSAYLATYLERDVRPANGG
jgi:predicted AAA+ superfamily ATPase